MTRRQTYFTLFTGFENTVAAEAGIDVRGGRTFKQTGQSAPIACFLVAIITIFTLVDATVATAVHVRRVGIVVAKSRARVQTGLRAASRRELRIVDVYLFTRFTGFKNRVSADGCNGRTRSRV